MTIYRTSDARAHWKVLTVIVKRGIIDGVDYTLPPALFAETQQLVRNFPRQVLYASSGMCVIRQKVVTITSPLTEANTNGPSPNGYIISWEDLVDLMVPRGIRVRQFDAWICLHPKETFQFGFIGVNFNPIFNSGYALCGIPEAGLADIQNVMVHEWTHSATVFYRDFMGFPIPQIDNADDYCDENGDPFAYGDDRTPFLTGVLSGKVTTCATGLDAGGMKSAVWASGTPRHNYPQ